MNSILRKGSKGSDVVQLQQFLKASGYYRGNIDGDFGSGTANAVLSFQQAKGLDVDGIVGARTWQALSASGGFTPTPATTSINSPLLLPGSRGTAVSEAQQLLKTKGYYIGRVDGDFGRLTRDAVVAFQTANALLVNGQVDEETWNQLRAPAIASPTVETVESVDIQRSEPDPKPTDSNIPPSSPLVTAWTAGTIYPPTAVPTDPTPPIISTSTPSTATPPTAPIATTPSTSSVTPTIAPTITPLPSEAVSPTPITLASSGKISLVDAAASYNQTKFVYQTEAIKTLDLQIGSTTRQEFLNRWNAGSSSILLTTSLEDAFDNYNGSEFPGQPSALKWLENQLAPAALDSFSRDWQNLPSSSFARVSFVDAANQYDRIKFPNQLNAISYLDRELTNTPDIKAQFIQRWTIATTGGSNMANSVDPSKISLVDIFDSYNGLRFPSQALALDWLQRQLAPSVLSEFSRQWRSSSPS
ncbi:hypothetical protein TUMEXPCC7403_10940 [Tumidithrix helvetica PCC 7403]|uniref:peptidoglycan-binding domain-containing protein n=1 Tax=Tumidithrix helvetica TaxID=3457545 RepID=UPI003CBD1140